MQLQVTQDHQQHLKEARKKEKKKRKNPSTPKPENHLHTIKMAILEAPF